MLERLSILNAPITKDTSDIAKQLVKLSTLERRELEKPENLLKEMRKQRLEIFSSQFSPELNENAKQKLILLESQKLETEEIVDEAIIKFRTKFPDFFQYGFKELVKYGDLNMVKFMDLQGEIHKNSHGIVECMEYLEKQIFIHKIYWNFTV